jgi:hypothetical protein
MNAMDAKRAVERNRTMVWNLPPQDDVLKLLEEASYDWHFDYQCDNLPGVLISANTFEPIFALLRHNSFNGSLIIGFLDGLPFDMIGRNAADSFEDCGDGTFKIKR